MYVFALRIPSLRQVSVAILSAQQFLFSQDMPLPDCGFSHTDCNLLKAKALFFLVTLSVVGWTRFQNSFYIDAGLSNTEIGALKSIGLICKFIGEPLLCMLADFTGHREMFLFCIAFNAISIETLRTASPLTFRIVLFVKVLRTFVAPTSTLTTTTTLFLTKGTTQGYGEQRAFGALGWGVGALLSGFLIDAAGMGGLFLYTYFLCALSFLIVAFGLPKESGRHVSSRTQTAEEEVALLIENEKGRGSNHYTSDENKLLFSNKNAELAACGGKSRLMVLIQKTVESIYPYYSALWVQGGMPVKVVLLNCALFGIVMSAVDTYLYVSVERDLDASRTVNGLLTTVSIATSVPVFWYSNDLIRRYGHDFVFQFSYLATMLRLGLCALATKMLADQKHVALSVIAVLQLLHGMTFAGYWSGVIDVVTAMSSKRGLLSGSVAVVNALYFTVGAAVGNLIWGSVYDSRGIVTVYILAGLLTLLSASLQGLLGNGVEEVLRRQNSLERHVGDIISED